jgi:hypothetical protein
MLVIKATLRCSASPVRMFPVTDVRLGLITGYIEWRLIPNGVDTNGAEMLEKNLIYDY